MGPKVVCTRPVLSTPYDDEVVQELGGAVVRVDCPTEEAVIEACRDADAAMGAVEPYSKRVIEQLDNCRIIAQYSVGFDHVDVEAARAIAWRRDAVDAIDLANALDIGLEPARRPREAVELVDDLELD